MRAFELFQEMTFWYIAIFLADLAYGGSLSVKTEFEWNWDMTNVSFFIKKIVLIPRDPVF